MGKKRGRPLKIKEENYEWLPKRTGAGGSISQLTTTPSPAVDQGFSPVLGLLEHKSPGQSRYMTRSVLAQFASLGTPLRYPIRNLKETPSQSSTMSPSKKVPDEVSDQSAPISRNYDSELPPETQVQKSLAGSSGYLNQQEKSAPDQNGTQTMGNCFPLESIDLSLPKSHDTLYMENLRSAYLAQRSECLHQSNPPVSEANELANENPHLPQMDANMVLAKCGGKTEGNGIENCNEKSGGHLTRTSSLNYTEIAEMLDNDSSDEVESSVVPALVTVNGYRVKEEVAPLLRSIFSKYGDIAKDSSLQTTKSRSFHLERVCEIYQRSEIVDFTTINTCEINLMLADIGDLEIVKLEVGWLHRRLKEISDALEAFKIYKTTKEEKARNLHRATELRDKMSLIRKEQAEIEAEQKKIDEKILDVKNKIRLCRRPLI